MPLDPESTRRRIFDAAVEEFAAYGGAGARVDRIAKNAHANKESIYRYYGTKDELLHRVLDKYLDEYGAVLIPKAMEPDEYVTGLFRHQSVHSELVRLLQWEALEFGADLDPGTVENRENHYAEKIASIAELQDTEEIDPEFDPRHLLLVLLSLAHYWHALPQVVRMIMGREPNAEDLAHHEAVLAECVRRIVAPPADRTEPAS